MKKEILKNVLVIVVLLAVVGGTVVYMYHKMYEEQQRQSTAWMTHSNVRQSSQPRICYIQAPTSMQKPASLDMNASVTTDAKPVSSPNYPNNLVITANQYTNNQTSGASNQTASTAVSSRPDLTSQRKQIQLGVLTMNTKRSASTASSGAMVAMADAGTNQPFSEEPPVIGPSAKVDIGGGPDEPFYVPIGDGWIMLVFALFTAGVIFVRRR